MLKPRVLSVTCLVVCLIGIPWTSAFAGEQPITNRALEASAQYRLEARRQSVATTTERNLLVGVTAGTLIVAGAAMIAYGASSTCKGTHVSSAPCDRQAFLGALGFSGGAAMLAVWALSR